MTRFHTLTLCGLASLLVLTGCPKENNDTNNKTPKKDMSSTDMPADDMSSDMVDMPAEDMAEDMKVGDARCTVLSYSPRTLPTDGSIQELSVLLKCDGDVSGLTDQPTLIKSALMEKREGTLTSFKRRELKEELLETYEAKLTGVTPPVMGEKALTGFEALTVATPVGEWSIPMRWHLPVAELAKQHTTQTVMALPEGYNTRGLDVSVKAISTGHMLLGAMANEQGDHIELFTSVVPTDGSAPNPSTYSADIDVNDIAAQGFDAYRLDSGNIASLWWAYNQTTSNFDGKIVEVDKDGNLVKERRLKTDAYQGPKIKQIFDSIISVRGPKGAQHVTVELLALTESNTITTIMLFDKGMDTATVELNVDAIGGVSAANMKPGLIQAIRSRNDHEAYAERKSSICVLSGLTKKLTIVPMEKSARLLTAQLNLDFEPEQMFVGAIDESSAFLLVHGKDNLRALYRVTLPKPGDLPGAAGTYNPISMPLNVDLRPSRPQGTFQPDAAFYTTGGKLAVAMVNNQATAFGRWPWNWRDKLKTSAQAEGRWPWNWREKLGMYQTVPMGVQWGADGALSSVHPVTQDEGAAPTTPGTTVMTGMQFGAVIGLNNTKMDPALCVNRDDCAVNIGTSPNGVGVNLLPGIKGPMFAIDKYGDILIDGVPLEFDLIGPPVIFDKPAKGGGFDGAVAIAPIAHATEPGATHAVWLIDKEGKPSKPAPVSFNFGEQAKELEFDNASSIKAGIVTPEDVAAFALQVVISIGVLPAKDDRAQTPRTATFSVPMADLVAAVSSDKASVIDVSKKAPFVGKVKGDGLVPGHPNGLEFMLPAPALMATAHDDLFSGEFVEEGQRTVTTLATLTAEQLAQPLIVRADENGAVTIYSKSEKNGEIVAGTVVTLPPKEVLLNIGFKTGDGTVQIFSMNYADFTGRVKRIRIRKKRVGSGFQLPEGATIELVETTVPLPQLKAFENGFPSVSGDVNGDGFEDEIIFGGYIDNAELRFGTTLVLFSDGFGGYLPGSWPLVGTPNTTPPIDNQGKTSGNGSGTRKGIKCHCSIHLDLL